MKVIHNYSLKQLNTFRIESVSTHFVEINSIDELLELREKELFKNNKILILGGGSNILFTKNFDGLVIQPNIRGIEIIKEDSASIYLKIGAGEVWEELVEYAVQKCWGGIENLACIPGRVGAAPIQNIGAYGVELDSVFQTLTAVNLKNGEQKVFSQDECEFGYRTSIFKTRLRNEYFITDITLKLKRIPVLNLTYAALDDYLINNNIPDPAMKDVFNAVLNIRKTKLPDPNKMGNAGSFFKNPLISKDDFDNLKKAFPQIKSYQQKDGSFKLAAAWLIENCGWKGKRIGEVGVHEKQALVIVNYGAGDGRQIQLLAEQIMKSVNEKFHIKLKPEVNIH